MAEIETTLPDAGASPDTTLESAPRVSVPSDLEQRISSGAIAHQKAWQFIRELNSSEEQLEATAIIDTRRTYTYRQFFRMWDEYAEVFSGLGITQDNGSRVGIVTTISASPIAAFYALNMLGVSVSMLATEEILVERWITNAIRAEHITDIVLPDTITRIETLHALMKNAHGLGLRHVILVRTSKDTAHLPKEAIELLAYNYRVLREVPGVVDFTELKRHFAAAPIAYGSGEIDEAAVIVHSSGTTKGTHKPVPLSDRALNVAALRLLVDERFSDMRGNANVLLDMPPAYAYSVVECLHLPLAFGCAIVPNHWNLDMTNATGSDAQDMGRLDINVLFTFPYKFDIWSRGAEKDGLDLSSIKLTALGGSAVSHAKMKSIDEFFVSYGAHPTIVNGYGLSECGGAVLLAVYDEHDHGIGRPLAGVTIRILDSETGTYHAPEDGPCVGVMYISSDSNTSGCIDDMTFCEFTDIDGTPYVNTHDMVRVDESGDVFCLGRENTFFVENDNVRFDAYRVEAALSDVDGIDECAIVGIYEKVLMHDTVPVLYVKTTGAKHRKRMVEDALRHIYVDEGLEAHTDLPWRCVLVEELPHNNMGKIDVHRMSYEPPAGREYAVIPVLDKEKLQDVRLVAVVSKDGPIAAMNTLSAPKETREDRAEMRRNLAGVFGAMLSALEDTPMMQEENEASLGISKRKRSGDKKSRDEMHASKKHKKAHKVKDRKGHKERKGHKKSRRSLRGAKGLALPASIDGPMRLLFGASDVDYTYEE